MGLRAAMKKPADMAKKKAGKFPALFRNYPALLDGFVGEFLAANGNVSHHSTRDIGENGNA